MNPGPRGIALLWSHMRALLGRRRTSCAAIPPDFPDFPPDSFVREPVRPNPLSGAGAAALPEPNGWV